MDCRGQSRAGSRTGHSVAAGFVSLAAQLVKEASFFDKRAALRSVPRLFAAGEQFDTRSVRRVFSDVHAAGEND